MSGLPSAVLDRSGSRVVLGPELGRGGEGAVCEVVGRPDLVAKIYFKDDPELAEKLAAMPGLATPDLLRIAAWPIDVLHDGAGRTCGFLMHKAGGFKPIFKLYSPRARLREFPAADWRFLIHAAGNTARAFSTVHHAGFVVGDVNHGNLFVGHDAIVKLIDCDSFQVSAGAKTWLCKVGVGTHQPPEMQTNASYALIHRTPNHDRFGLAVLIFQLLCMNRHPFAGLYRGTGEQPTIDEAIRASRYAFSRDGARTQMAAPPGSLPIEALTPELRDLFERAFAPNAAQQGRPEAVAWIAALAGLSAKLAACHANPAHYFRSGLTACPWCAIENANGVTLFPVVFVPGRTAAVGIAALWQEVERVPRPAPLSPWPSDPAATGRPSPQARAVGRKARLLRWPAWAMLAIAVLLVLAIAAPSVRVWLGTVLLAGAMLNRQYARKIVGPFRSTLLEARREWETLRAAWVHQAGDVSFDQIKARLATLKAAHDALPPERTRRLQRLHEQRRERQLRDHLERFLIADATIPGVGAAKIATLASHGIDTAADVTLAAVRRVSGFKDVLSARLVAWRKTHESSFRFDPARGVSAAETALVERDIATQGTKLQTAMATGLTALRRTADIGARQHASLLARRTDLASRYAQARTDAAVAREDRAASIRLACLSAVVATIAIVTAPPAALLGHPDAPPAPPSQPLRPLLAPSRLPPAADLAARQGVLDGLPAAGVALAFPIGEIHMRQAGNVRSGADASSPVVQIAAAGVMLHVFRREHGWLQVGNGVPIGWVAASLTDDGR